MERPQASNIINIIREGKRECEREDSSDISRKMTGREKIQGKGIAIKKTKSNSCHRKRKRPRFLSSKKKVAGDFF
jgi:hypothetical protein